jgi:hypothetical protein
MAAKEGSLAPSEIEQKAIVLASSSALARPSRWRGAGRRSPCQWWHCAFAPLIPCSLLKPLSSPIAGRWGTARSLEAIGEIRRKRTGLPETSTSCRMNAVLLSRRSDELLIVPRAAMAVLQGAYVWSIEADNWLWFALCWVAERTRCPPSAVHIASCFVDQRYWTTPTRLQVYILVNYLGFKPKILVRMYISASTA